MRLVHRHWFLITLAICFWAGHQFAGTVRLASHWPFLRPGIVFAVMLATGLSLKATAIRDSVTRPLAAIIAVASNVVLVPLLVYPTQIWLGGSAYGGLVVASLVPCTLASAAVWTRRAGGDDSIAILTTVATNLTCVLVVPLGLRWMLLRQSELAIADQATKLAVIVLAPLVIAQWLRTVVIAGRRAARWADQHKRRITFFSQCGILAMVVLGSAQSSQVWTMAASQNTATQTSLKQRTAASETAIGNTAASQPADTTQPDRSGRRIAVLVGSVAGVHLLAFLLALAAGRLGGLGRDQQIACGIAGSQKTLMVGLQIAIDCGASVLPMLLYHASQLLIDTVLADRWRVRSENLLGPRKKAQVG